jgi:hypothetical protein
MRIRVQIDVRLPLKKDTKVKDKEGNWCTTKFKYEKLGIFCFVCGVMGHTENKCEIRFSMEQDDGVREWSAEIRAEPRRQGGRLVSRWLREEKGGRPEVGGSAVPRQTIPVMENTDVASTGADMASSNLNNSQNSQNPIHSPIMTPINARDHTLNPFIKSQNESSSLITPGPTKNHTAFIPTSETEQPLISAKNMTFTPLLTATNGKTVFPFHQSPMKTNNSPIITNESLPITINMSKTETIIPPSLNHQIIAFNSQPITRDPQQTKQPTHKNPRAHKIQIYRPNIKSNPDPKLAQPRPGKKPKPSENFPNPTQNLIGTVITQENLADLDVQGEKKRRRDDETSDNAENLQETEHFLTAGPGSQACRDQ